MKQICASHEQTPVSPCAHESLNNTSKMCSPTEEEKREHLLHHHCPYNALCPFCVGSKGRMRVHSMRKDKENDLVPEVSWDFNTYSTGNVETINGMDRKTGTAICFQTLQRQITHGFQEDS